MWGNGITSFSPPQKNCCVSTTFEVIQVLWMARCRTLVEQRYRCHFLLENLFSFTFLATTLTHKPITKEKTHTKQYLTKGFDRFLKVILHIHCHSSQFSSQENWRFLLIKRYFFQILLGQHFLWKLFLQCSLIIYTVFSYQKNKHWRNTCCISLGFYTNFLYSSARILVLVTAIFIQTAFCKNSAQYSKYITILMKPKKAKKKKHRNHHSL